MKRAPNQPITTALVIFGGVYAKAYSVPDEGTILPQHSHKTAHITALISGAIRVWIAGASDGIDYKAPAMIKIEALAAHTFLTLTADVSLICIHNADKLDAAGEPAIHDTLVLELED